MRKCVVHDTPHFHPVSVLVFVSFASSFRDETKLPIFRLIFVVSSRLHTRLIPLVHALRLKASVRVTQHSTDKGNGSDSDSDSDNL